ncbi:mitochondrial carrier [Backusella circina FSU 941]|nr:mitochondrial carrier [Backusella circina FSU 941]
MTTVKINPHRPYYTPGLQRHNYTSLPSNDAAPPVLNLLDEKENTALKGMTTRFTSFALLKYFVTMSTSPFEVGTTLLQVQYSPHQDVEVMGIPEPSIQPVQTHSSIGFTSSDEEEEEGEGSFYQRPERVSLDTVRLKADSLSVSVYDDENRPNHQMAPMEGGGVLEILSMIVKQPTEGWKSLFKGQRVTWFYEMLRTVLRPGLESFLNDLFGLYDDTIPLMHLDSVTPNITTMVISHVVVGVLLSPLEIIRTRLVVQSSSPLCSKYNGPFHALRTMLSEEGGLRGVYLSKNLLPTLFYHTITPLLSCSTPLIINRVLGISAADSPILYGAAELALSTLGLIVTLPLETIRKRLHCQVPGGNFKTAVAIRPVPYRGVLDALYKIMKEEGTKNKRNDKSKLKRKQRQNMFSSDSESDHDDLFPARRQEEKAVTSAWGIRGLYRGFGMQLAANIMVFVFHTMNGIEDGFNNIM